MLSPGRWNTPEDIQIDWQMFMDKKNKELQRLNGVYDKLLGKAGVTYIEGRGKLVDAHTIDVDGKRYTVGTSARCPVEEAGPCLIREGSLVGAHPCTL